MRITDAFLAFPSIVLILMLASVLGPSIINVVIVLGVLSWTGSPVWCAGSSSACASRTGCWPRARSA